MNEADAATIAALHAAVVQLKASLREVITAANFLLDQHRVEAMALPSPNLQQAEASLQAAAQVLDATSA